MTYIDFIINLIALKSKFIMSHIIGFTEVLSYIGFIFLYVLFMYVMVFWVRPIQRLLKVDAVIETVMWVCVLLLYGAYLIFIKQ